MFLKTDDNQLVPLERHIFSLEAKLQQLLVENPEIVYGLIENELVSTETVVKIREYSTTVGSVDVLYITKSADIILVETKLLRNPESTRTVIAQTIDYIKALTSSGFKNLIDSLRKRDIIFRESDSFMSALCENIEHGNIRGIILGDDISPNLLGLVDAVQSAPHLAFTLYLARLEAFECNGGLILSPTLVEATREIERSIINITVNTTNDIVTIDSEAPSKDQKGTNKPIQTWDEYLDTVSPEYKYLIEQFVDKWKEEIEIDRNMGVRGFSLGVTYLGKRVAVQEIFNDYLVILTDRKRLLRGIPDEAFLLYREQMKKSPRLFDEYITSNRANASFKDLSNEEIDTVFAAALACARYMRDTTATNKEE